MDTAALFSRLGLERALLADGDLEVRTPVTGEPLARTHRTNAAGTDAAIGRAVEAFEVWRDVPAPRRGELVRLLGEELRAREGRRSARWSRSRPARSLQEGLGEVQEMIDICDFAVGLSRQLYGLTIASERPGHRMIETWHPLGPVGVITAFNFPVAVWAWNAALALVCGDPVVWKPSREHAADARSPCQALLAPVRGGAAATPRTGLLEVVDRRRRVGDGAGGRPSAAAGLGHRLDRDGPARRAAASRPRLGPLAARAGRQQRR